LPFGSETARPIEDATPDGDSNLFYNDAREAFIKAIAD
jgi:hypothetical protein